MKQKAYAQTMDSPLGVLTLLSNGNALTAIRMGDESLAVASQSGDSVLAEAKRQLNHYFAGTLSTFDIPLEPVGTPFQKQVWRALSAIPYGKTASYKDVAVMIGNPKACRAVGMANGKNPICIVVPCHRVINRDGSLGGYTGGLSKKRALLSLETDCLERC